MFPTRCPRCASALEVVRLRCTACSTQVEGAFPLHPLLQLEQSELEFLLEFVRASGSLKKMAAHYQLSYPTIRNRLDGLIAKLDRPARSVDEQRLAILDRVARGELTAAEGARRLEELSDRDER